MVQPAQEIVANKGDDIGPSHVSTTHVTPKGDSTLSSSGNGLHGTGEPEYVGNGQHGTIQVSPVLEEEAQSKGRWFQYVKTKQFWLVLLLGQGMFNSSQFSNSWKPGYIWLHTNNR
jgi:solute carrier family 35 protein F1/2